MRLCRLTCLSVNGAGEQMKTSASSIEKSGHNTEPPEAVRYGPDIGTTRLPSPPPESRQAARNRRKGTPACGWRIPVLRPAFVRIVGSLYDAVCVRCAINGLCYSGRRTRAVAGTTTVTEKAARAHAHAYRSPTDRAYALFHVQTPRFRRTSTESVNPRIVVVSACSSQRLRTATRSAVKAGVGPCR